MALESIQTKTKGELPLEVQDEISLAKTQLGEAFESQQKAILRIGTALQKVFAEKPEKICAHIKFVLKEFIENETLSAKTIERICPEEWKNPVKAEAGRAGADKVSAKRKIKVPAGGGSEAEGDGPSRQEFETVREQLKEVQTTLESFMPKFRAVNDHVIREDGYVKIPENEWDELIRAAPVDN